MSTNEIITFNENEENVYQKSLSLMNKKISNKDLISTETLDKLYSVFDELEKNNSKNKDIDVEELSKKNFSFDFSKIISSATHEQMIVLFKELAKISHLSKKEISQIQPLYHFITGALIHSKKNDSEKITMDEFIDYLNLDILVRTFFVRPDFSKDLIHHLNKYFKGIPLLDLNNTTQTEEVYQEHFILVTKLKKVLFFPDSQEFKNNTIIMEVINTIMNMTKNVEEDSVQHYVSELLFNGSPNPQDLEKINIILDDFSDSPEYISNNKVIYGILDSILNNDLENLIQYTDEYIELYLNKASYKENKTLTIEDKTILFFTNYFFEFQSYTNHTYRKFIDIFIDYYDKDLFFGFMEHYKIPFNLGVREEKTFTNQNNEPIVVQSYYSLIEIALFSNNFLMADHLLDVDNILEPINIRVVEDKNVFEYQTNPFDDLFYLEETHFLFLIEMGIINEDFKFHSPDEDTEDFVDPFTYFIKNGYDQCFIKLYKLNKEQNQDFVLKKYFSHFGLLNYYFLLLKEYDSDSVNGEILNIFKEEGYSLYEENDEGITSLDLLKDLDIHLVVHIVAMLKDMFKKENTTETNSTYQNTIDSVITPHQTSELIPWFNRSDLELHYKKLSKGKDSDRHSSLEFIKSMLSDNNHLRKNLILDNEVFFDDLKAKFPNFKEVLDFYKGQFRLKSLTGKTRIQPILLLGEAGVGKTYFAKELAHLLNTGYTFIDMGSLTSNWVLSGNNASWKNAKQGKILESLMKSKTINPLILMDELDKARGGEWDPTMVLYQLLEEINANEFIDEYIDFPFNASSIMYIACANSIQTIPEPLISRFKIFTIHKPEDEQHSIVINNIYQEAIKNAKIFSSELDPVIVKKLKAFSLRSAKVAIDDAISKSLLELTPEQIEQKIKDGDKVSLTTQHFKDPTKKASYGFNNQ